MTEIQEETKVTGVQASEGNDLSDTELFDKAATAVDLSAVSINETDTGIDPALEQELDAAIEAAEAVEEELDTFLLTTAITLNLPEAQFEELSGWVDKNIRNTDVPAEVKSEAVGKLQDMVAMAKRLENEGLATAHDTITEACSRIEHSLSRGNLDKIDSTTEAIDFRARYPHLQNLDTKKGMNGKVGEFIESLPETQREEAREIFNAIAEAPMAKEALTKAASFPDFHAPHALAALYETGRESGGPQALQQFAKSGGWRHEGTPHLLVHSKAIRGRIECGGCRYSDLEANFPDVINNQIAGAEKLPERFGPDPSPTKQFGYLSTGQTYEREDGTMIHVRWHTPEPSFTSDDNPVAIVTNRNTGEFMLHVESQAEYKALSRAVDRVSDGTERLGPANADGSIWISPSLWDRARERGGVQARVILSAGHIEVDPREDLKERRAS